MAGETPPLLVGLKAWGSSVTRSSGGPGTVVFVLFSQWELNWRVADASGKGGFQRGPPFLVGLKPLGSCPQIPPGFGPNGGCHQGGQRGPPLSCGANPPKLGRHAFSHPAGAPVRADTTGDSAKWGGGRALKKWGFPTWTLPFLRG